MHPRPAEMHIAIDSYFLIVSFELIFLYADMFPYYEDSYPVCLFVPREKKSH